MGLIIVWLAGPSSNLTGLKVAPESRVQSATSISAQRRLTIFSFDVFLFLSIGPERTDARLQLFSVITSAIKCLVPMPKGTKKARQCNATIWLLLCLLQKYLINKPRAELWSPFNALIPLSNAPVYIYGLHNLPVFPERRIRVCSVSDLYKCPCMKNDGESRWFGWCSHLTSVSEAMHHS